MNKKLILGFAIAVVMLVSCNNQIETKNDDINLADSISHYEKLLYSGKPKVDSGDAMKLADFYQYYAIENENDSLSPEYLFKAADINMNMNQPKRSIICFTILLEKYPYFEKSPTALFLKAFVYENQLLDYVNAEKYYKLFLNQYPDSDFADDAEISLKNMGKTPEELIEEFEKMNK